MPETPLDESRPEETRPDETAPDGTAHAVSPSSLTAAREVRAVFSRLRRRLRDSTDTRGLTPSQTSVIGRLDKLGPASVAVLAARERVRHQSMAATVGVLEERGLVERRPDPEDGRSRLISLTADGRSLLEDRRRAGEEWLTRTLDDHCTEDERRAVLAAMAVLARVTEL
ncbi:MAG: MarR family transcriptional regulator [Streptomycetaceae bacterium]|nr:MarR family transcriptional regulator [Streptomycetaceae bacterium]